MQKSLTAALTGGLRRVFRAEVIRDGIPLTDQSFWRGWGGNSSFTGELVSVDNALKLATVWACVRLISETIATLPLGFFQRNADGSRTSATNHQLYEILHNQPNGDQTAVVFWEVVLASMLLWGNAYVEVIRNTIGGVTALRFLYPARVSLRRLTNGTYQYFYRDQTTSEERVIPEARMMHIPAFSTDGVRGLSPILHGANVMSTAIETDRASAETFKNSLRSTGVVTMDMVFNKGQREEVRAMVQKVSASGGVLVLEKGGTFQPLGFDPVSTELLASRAWNVEEMCRWYGVDPSLIGHGAKDSNWGTGLEQKMLWLVTLTLRKWCVRIEQAVRKSLLSPVERTKYFAEFALEGLLRGDSTSRAAFFASAVQNGWKTRNDVRKLENDPPMPGGDVLTVQSNLIPLDRVGDNVPAPQDRRATDQANTSIASLQSDVKAMHAMLSRQQPLPQAINVDARTTVAASPAAQAPDVHFHEGAIKVETKASDVNFQEGAINVEHHAGDNNIVIPETKAPDVHVEVAAPVVNVVAPENHVHVEGMAENAQATRLLAETMAKPMKPVYDARGNLLGGERVERLEKR